MRTSSVIAVLAFSFGFLSVVEPVSAQVSSAAADRPPVKTDEGNSDKHKDEWSVIWHNPSISNQHQPETSAQHDTRLSKDGHTPSISVRHDTEKSELWRNRPDLGPHFEDRSRLHLDNVSKAGHRPLVSSDHTLIISHRHKTDVSATGHLPLQSGLHIADRSERHNDEVSDIHDMSKSHRHLPEHSEAHITDYSQGGHRIWDTLGHADILSRRGPLPYLPPTRPEHETNMSLKRHEVKHSLYHEANGSANHTDALSKSGHQTYDSRRFQP
jgi:hypothetical protein